MMDTVKEEVSHVTYIVGWEPFVFSVENKSMDGVLQDSPVQNTQS